MTVSQDIYNKFAPFYRQYSSKKSAYINSIDNLVIQNVPKNADSVLDIGSGDGVRGFKIYERLSSSELTQVDNSQGMINANKDKKGTKLLKLDVTDKNFPKNLGKYDVILCLWNVLGHIRNNQLRIQTLKNIKSLLKPNGLFFIDVSNRYNFRYYGLKNAFKNIIKDIIYPNNKNGDFKYQIKISEKIEIQAENHFFIDFEMQNLFKKTTLKIIKRVYVDYDSGKKRNTQFEGQLFYVLKIK